LERRRALKFPSELPGHSGATAPEFHRLPIDALNEHPKAKAAVAGARGANKAARF
jgi:hypothetical protein